MVHCHGDWSRVQGFRSWILSSYRLLRYATTPLIADPIPTTVLIMLCAMSLHDWLLYDTMLPSNFLLLRLQPRIMSLNLVFLMLSLFGWIFASVVGVIIIFFKNIFYYYYYRVECQVTAFPSFLQLTKGNKCVGVELDFEINFQVRAMRRIFIYKVVI